VDKDVLKKLKLLLFRYRQVLIRVLEFVYLVRAKQVNMVHQQVIYTFKLMYVIMKYLYVMKITYIVKYLLALLPLLLVGKLKYQP
jgi:hypothetical protein